MTPIYTGGKRGPLSLILTFPPPPPPCHICKAKERTASSSFDAVLSDRRICWHGSSGEERERRGSKMGNFFYQARKEEGERERWRIEETLLSHRVMPHSPALLPSLVFSLSSQHPFPPYHFSFSIAVFPLIFAFFSPSSFLRSLVQWNHLRPQSSPFPKLSFLVSSIVERGGREKSRSHSVWP